MRKLISRFLNSNIGYLPFKVIEGVCGLVSITLYTYLLSKDVYGSYGIVNSTMMILYLVCIGWSVFVANRYIKEQKTESDKKNFFTNLIALHISTVTFIAVIYIIASIFMLKTMNYNPKLLFAYIPFFLGYTLNQFYVYLLLYDNKRFLNIILTVIAAVAKPIMVYILFLQKIPSIYILYLSHGVIDLIVGIIAIFNIKPYRYFDSTRISYKKFKEYFSYGFPLIGLTLTMYILNISDRYIIRIFFDDAAVGIYSPNYSIAAATFTMLTYGLSRGFYPNLLEAWKSDNNKKVKAENILKRAVKNYILLAFPAAIGLSLLSGQIGEFLLAKEYQEGTLVIGLVAFGMLFLGLAEYANKEWELSSNTKPIFKNSIIAAVINIVLNFILIPSCGYIGAAFTTCISFIIYFLICFLRRKNELDYSVGKIFIIKAILANIVMIIAVIFSGKLQIFNVSTFATNIAELIIRVIIGVIAYFAIIIGTKAYK